MVVCLTKEYTVKLDLEKTDSNVNKQFFLLSLWEAFACVGPIWNKLILAINTFYAVNTVRISYILITSPVLN